MLSYFNHAIAYIPEFDLYLDGTAEFSGINELPAMDQGALTLLVHKDGSGRLTHIPVQDNNRQDYALELDLQADGAANISGELFYEGVITPDVRQYLSIESKLSKNLQDLLADTVPGLDVEEAAREGERINDPIRLKFRGTSRQLLQVGNGSLKLPLNILNRYLTQAYTPNARRKFPIDFGVPKTMSVAVRVDAPEGYQLGEHPETLEVEDDNFKVKIRFDKETPERCLIDYQVAFKSTRVEPADYSSLRNIMQAHDRVLDQAIHFVVR